MQILIFENTSITENRILKIDGFKTSDRARRKEASQILTVLRSTISAATYSELLEKMNKLNQEE